MTTPSPTARPLPPRRSGVVVPHQPTWQQRLAGTCVYLAIRALAATIRFDARGAQHFLHPQPQGAFIFAIWHNRLALSLVIYHRFLASLQPSRRLAALVSASRDGGFLTSILHQFHVEPVRGSSSRRGPQALRELVSWGERGYDLAITPDGPRGPRYQVQDGVIALAQITGMPIIPTTYHLSRKIQAGSWDRFQIPLPFGRCQIRLGTPLHVPRNATDAEREQLRQTLETSLRELSLD
jgi:hypothetical protein